MASPEKIQDSRRLIGYAVSFDTKNIISSIPAGDHFGQRVAKLVKENALQTKKFAEHPVHPRTYTVLANGINDVDMAVRHAASHYGEQEAMNELLDVFRQAETIHTLAQHARFSEEVLRRALHDDVFSSADTHTLALNSDSKTLQTTENFDELWSYYPPVLDRGCPLAIPDAEQKLDPLFTSFSKWASELSIRSLYHYRS